MRQQEVLGSTSLKLHLLLNFRTIFMVLTSQGFQRHRSGNQHTSKDSSRSFLVLSEYEVGGYSSDSTPSLGTSICRKSGPRNGRKTKKKKKKTEAVG